MKKFEYNGKEIVIITIHDVNSGIANVPICETCKEKECDLESESGYYFNDCSDCFWKKANEWRKSCERSYHV